MDAHFFHDFQRLFIVLSGATTRTVVLKSYAESQWAEISVFYVFNTGLIITMASMYNIHNTRRWLS